MMSLSYCNLFYTFPSGVHTYFALIPGLLCTFCKWIFTHP